MAPGSGNPALARQLIESMQGDLRLLSAEAKKKHPMVKEVAERTLLQLRQIESAANVPEALTRGSEDILRPFILGCDSKNPRLVQLSVHCIQRLISHNAVSQAAVEPILLALWSLMEQGTEEVKILQCILSMLTSSDLLHAELMSKAIVLCFRLYFGKESLTSATAAATLRQVVTVIFDRVVTEDAEIEDERQLTGSRQSVVDSKSPRPPRHRKSPKNLQPYAADAYLLFQDLCHLTNGDAPYWLVGIVEMSRTFGLELLESALVSHPEVFLKHPEFSFLLKERVCPLVIRLFSPVSKNQLQHGQPQSQQPPAERTSFSVSVRLLRMVCALVKKFYTLLVTESEIFLSMLIKFLDPDKPAWQRSLALEVFRDFFGHPELIRSICQYYDMQKHSTKVFRDMISALGGLSQSIINAQQQLMQSAASQPVIPVVPTHPTPQKRVYLDCLDKADPPTTSDAYALSVALACLLDLVASLSTLVLYRPTDEHDESGLDGAVTRTTKRTPAELIDSKDRPVWRELIDSSWLGVLSALSQLLRVATDEATIQAVLKALQTYINLAGVLDMGQPRDAYVGAICKGAMPTPSLAPALATDARADAIFPPYDLAWYGSIGNISCMKCLMNVAHCLGPILCDAWYPVLEVLLRLDTALGLHQLDKTAASSRRGPQEPRNTLHRSSSNPSLNVVAAVPAVDLSMLSSMLSRLFESSQFLPDAALRDLLGALCRLSGDEADRAGTAAPQQQQQQQQQHENSRGESKSNRSSRVFSFRQEQLFALSKIKEIGVANIARADVFWEFAIAHLLEVAASLSPNARECAVAAMVDLIEAGLSWCLGESDSQRPGESSLPAPPLRTPGSADGERLVALVMYPLRQLSRVVHTDAREKQLECLYHVLQTAGQSLGTAWPAVFEIIGTTVVPPTTNALEDTGAVDASLVRLAFQGLQLVIADFLATLPVTCLATCVDAVTRFGLQRADMNISLTAIGLLWNVSDFLSQNRVSVSDALARHAATQPPATDRPTLDGLWLAVFAGLAELCVDPRPEVRKSASQTLFSTVQAHGALLQPSTWHACMWRILFPLLDNIKAASTLASNQDTPSIIGGGGDGRGIIVHHSRNTAAKQWDETRVLSLAGVARVFAGYQRSVASGARKGHADAELTRAWALLLEFVEGAALSDSREVALAAVDALKDLLRPPSSGADQPSLVADAAAAAVATEMSAVAWRAWERIGTLSTEKATSGHVTDAVVPQDFLASLAEAFVLLHRRMRGEFGDGETRRALRVIRRIAACPTGDRVNAESDMVSKPQAAVLAALAGLDPRDDGAWPLVLGELLWFASLASDKAARHQMPAVAARPPGDFVPFAKRSLKTAAQLYSAHARTASVVQGRVFELFLKTLQVPLALKYACPSQSLWRLSLDTLRSIIPPGIAALKKPGADLLSKEDLALAWKALASVFSDFLFTKSLPADKYSALELQADEQLDVRLVQDIASTIFPLASDMPPGTSVVFVDLLRRGSMHVAAADDAHAFGPEPVRPLREDFARACFDGLLRFSFEDAKGLQRPDGASLTVSKTAVRVLLERCKDVLGSYVHDEELAGQCPLPRTRMAEVYHVLRATSSLVDTLISDAKNGGENDGDLGVRSRTDSGPRGARERALVMELYPNLVACVTCGDAEMRVLLRDVLSRIGELLAIGTSLL